MWTPFAKPWKGKPEFEGVPEPLCRQALQQAMDARPQTVTLGAVAGMVVGGVMTVSLAWYTRRWWNSLPLEFQGDYELWYTAGMLLLGVMIVLPGVAIGRDLAAARVLQAALDRCRCPTCRYPLMGIPVWHNGIGIPQPGTATIRCPECGFQGNLLEMGLTPNELIPYQERIVPSDVGEFHRRYRGKRA